MDTVANPLQSADYGFLQYLDSYRTYFRLIESALRKMTHLHEAGHVPEATHEAEFEKDAIADAARRLLKTVYALRVRSASLRKDEHPLYIDLSDSGFPNFHEISVLEKDVQSVGEKSEKMSALPKLKRALVDRIIASGNPEPEEELVAVGQRAYFELLAKPSELFLPFYGGTLKHLGDTDNRRRYVYSWGSYDSSANQPSLYVLLFEQPLELDPMEQRGPDWNALRERIQAAGSHAAPIIVMANDLDEVPGVYPKLLKRLTLGPLFTPDILDARTDALTVRELAIRELLSSVAEEEPFLLCASHEFAISEREEASKTLLSALGMRKVKQIFRIPQEDLEALERHASELHRIALLPHDMVQHLTLERRQFVPELGEKTTLFPFNEKGEITDVIGGTEERYSD